MQQKLNMDLLYVNDGKIQNSFLSGMDQALSASLDKLTNVSYKVLEIEFLVSGW